MPSVTDPASPSSGRSDLRKATGPRRRSTASASRSRRGEIFGLLGPEWRRQDDHGRDARGPPQARRRHATVLGIDVARAARRAQGAHRRPAPDGRALPAADGRRAHRPLRELLPRGAARPTSSSRRSTSASSGTAGPRTCPAGSSSASRSRWRWSTIPSSSSSTSRRPASTPQARRSLWDLIAASRRRGTTILLTTHYMEEAEALCDRLAIMDHGQILELGTVDELVGRRFQELSVRFDAVDGLAGRAPRGRCRRCLARGRTRTARWRSTRGRARRPSARCSSRGRGAGHGARRT